MEQISSREGVSPSCSLLYFVWDVMIKWWKELRGTLNLTHWNRDKADWIFVLEFEEQKSRQIVEIRIDRKIMWEIFFDNLHQCKDNCTIVVPKNLWKQKEKKVVWIKKEKYWEVSKKEIEEYLKENWMENEGWIWYPSNRQWGIRYLENWERQEEVYLYRYI